MEREYIQVRPSRESLNPDDIVSHISSLHKLTHHGNKNTIRSRLNPLEDSSEQVPEFEFLAISQGKDSPVEFLYGTNGEHINALKNRLTTAYPSSFDVELVKVDVLEKIIPPERYAPEDFVKKLEGGDLLFDPDATGTVEDITGDHTGKTTAGEEPEEEPDSENNDPQDSHQSQQTGSEGEGQQPSKTPTTTTGDDNMMSLDVSRPSETTKPKQEEDAVDDSGEKLKLNPDQLDGYDMLKEIDAGLLDLVELPDEIDGSYLEREIDGPTWTEDGDILARPTLEHGVPVAARWDGGGERKKDWMTTMKMFSKVASPGEEDIQDRAPLATLIQHLASSDLPIAFQVVFKRIEDWSRQAERRKDNLHLNRDTLGQKVMYELGEILHAPSAERRRERMRDYMEDIGESADMNAESPVAGDVGKRRKLIDNKIPKRTFRANLRAISVANDEVSIHDVERTMDDLASVLDHIDGYFYGLEPTILKDGEGYRNKKKATEEFHRLVNREIKTGSGKIREDIVVNADELANFITVPSSENLTVEGVRGTRAEAEARDPLPKPDPDLMKEFHKPGMRIGYALDKEAGREPVPTQVPPGLLTTHYGRFATTGAGKSKALINDILSLYENTDGPTILIDPKGDGMTQNYLRAHFERFGEEDFKENVIHFPLPDILPGFSFFNIEKEVEQRVQEKQKLSKDKLRNDVVQNKADYYQELLKLVMGVDSYQDSKVAPILISSFIKILYDEEYVKQRQRDKEQGNDEEDHELNERPSDNYFTHRQLEELSRQVQQGQAPDKVSYENKPIKQTIQEQIEGDEHTFSVIMNSVFNRLNYIREDQHLRRIFNNTEPQFDFRDHLNDNKVILFDLGGLRDDASTLITGLVLTELWDALQSSPKMKCTKEGMSVEDAREKARKNGLDPSDPPHCEPWPDDHLVNLIIDEAASVTVSDILTKMLEQGRSFHLSVGLSMQFPEQMKDSSERVYKNVLNNVATKLIGKITLDEEIAKAMAHEGMDVDEFNDRISALPRGEWIAQLPSPNFMETGPEPFSLQPLPIPSGHPESEHVLTEEADQRFEHFLENTVHRRTREEYGVKDSANLSSSGTSNTSNTDGSEQTSTNEQTNESEDTSSPGNEDDYADTELDEVNLPSDVLDDDVVTEASGDEEPPDSELPDSPEGTSGEPGAVEPVETTDGGTTTDTGSSTDTSSGLAQIGKVEGNPDDLPPHIDWDDNIGIYTCQVCHTEYYPSERKEATTCCQNRLPSIREKIGDPSNIESLSNADGYITSTESYPAHTDEVQTLRTTVVEEDLSFAEEPSVSDQAVERERHLPKIINKGNKETIGGVASTLIAKTPPQYHAGIEHFIDYYIDQLKGETEKLDDDIEPTEAGFRELIYEIPPADVNVKIEDLLTWTYDDISDEVLALWRNNDCDPAFKRFYSGRVKAPGTKLARTGKYGVAYNPALGLETPIDPTYTEPVAFVFPDDLSEEDDDDSQDDDSVPLEKFTVPGIGDDHLSEHGITRDEADFMGAVVKAMNNDLEGYNLINSMTKIKSLYDIDEEKLQENGYLKRHSGVQNRAYYTVTVDGQKACQMTKQHGRGVVDLGDHTPHRVGVELIKQYYESLPNVRRVELSPKEAGKEVDLCVYDDNGNRYAIIEVEGGRITADTGVEDGDSPGINNYESVRKDYELLAQSDGEKVWVVRNYEVAGSVLQALNSSDDIDLDLDEDTVKDVKDTTLRMTDLNEKLNEMNASGVDKLLTYKQIRNKLNDND